MQELRTAASTLGLSEWQLNYISILVNEVCVAMAAAFLATLGKQAPGVIGLLPADDRVRLDADVSGQQVHCFRVC